MVSRKKRVIVLGATGMMGQKFVELLADHPWFEIAALAASDRSVGKSYDSLIGERSMLQLPDGLGRLQLVEPDPSMADNVDIVFSALPPDVAGPIETNFAKAGFPVFTNASPHRMDPFVPLLNPEVNPEHSNLIEDQKKYNKSDGFIVANPNCTTAILTLSLKPLHERYGLQTVIVTSMQAISGAGYPGVASLDILGNVIPFIRSEEEKVENETNKLLGTQTLPASITVSASCNRVPTINGHIESVFVKTQSEVSPGEAGRVMSEFKSLPQRMMLPTAPAMPIIVRTEENRPQTRLDVDEGHGMSVSVGRLRRDSALKGLKYVVLGHNLVRGGAGCSILNAELLLAQKHIQ
jgi:aspartate-semialdehyde dehydrogenase